MASRYRDNHPTPRQRHQETLRCGYAMAMPDFTTTLTVTYKGGTVAQTADLERSEVRDELHRLRSLFPLSSGYDITALVKERAS